MTYNNITTLILRKTNIHNAYLMPNYNKILNYLSKINNINCYISLQELLFISIVLVSSSKAFSSLLQANICPSFKLHSLLIPLYCKIHCSYLPHSGSLALKNKCKNSFPLTKTPNCNCNYTH